MVAAEMKEGARQGELVAAIEPVVDRLLKKLRSARDAFTAAQAAGDHAAAKDAQGGARPFPRRPGRLRAALHVPVPRSSTTATPTSRSERSSSAACCRCSRSVASVRESTCPRWSSPITRSSRGAAIRCRCNPAATIHPARNGAATMEQDSLADEGGAPPPHVRGRGFSRRSNCVPTRPPHYSALSASVGSTLRARRVGTTQARRQTASMKAA